MCTCTEWLLESCYDKKLYYLIESYISSSTLLVTVTTNKIVGFILALWKILFYENKHKQFNCEGEKIYFIKYFTEKKKYV